MSFQQNGNDSIMKNSLILIVIFSLALLGCAHRPPAPIAKEIHFKLLDMSPDYARKHYRDTLISILTTHKLKITGLFSTVNLYEDVVKDLILEGKYIGAKEFEKGVLFLYEPDSFFADHKYDYRALITDMRKAQSIKIYEMPKQEYYNAAQYILRIPDARLCYHKNITEPTVDENGYNFKYKEYRSGAPIDNYYSTLCFTTYSGVSANAEYAIYEDRMKTNDNSITLEHHDVKLLIKLASIYQAAFLSDNK